MLVHIQPEFLLLLLKRSKPRKGVAVVSYAPTKNISINNRGTL